MDLRYPEGKQGCSKGLRGLGVWAGLRPWQQVLAFKADSGAGLLCGEGRVTLSRLWQMLLPFIKNGTLEEGQVLEERYVWLIESETLADAPVE